MTLRERPGPFGGGWVGERPAVRRHRPGAGLHRPGRAVPAARPGPPWPPPRRWWTPPGPGGPWSGPSSATPAAWPTAGCSSARCRRWPLRRGRRGRLGRARALRPEPGEPVVVKQYASAFFGTSLAATLHARGVDTVVIAGVSTSGCVRATAMDALNTASARWWCADACADRHRRAARDQPGRPRRQVRRRRRPARGAAPARRGLTPADAEPLVGRDCQTCRREHRSGTGPAHGRQGARPGRRHRGPRRRHAALLAGQRRRAGASEHRATGGRLRHLRSGQAAQPAGPAGRLRSSGGRAGSGPGSTAAAS